VLRSRLQRVAQRHTTVPIPGRPRAAAAGQFCDGFVRRVRIDLERLAQNPNRWKRIAWIQLAANNALFTA